MSVNKRTAFRNFKGLMKATNKVIMSRYEKDFAAQIQQKSKEEFEQLIPEIPYVGGSQNKFGSMLLINAAVILSLYKALKKAGVSLEEFGGILEEITNAYMNAYPSWVRLMARKLWMSRIFRKQLQKQAANSQKRNYEEDFVYEIIPGEKNQQWGINYIECGITKFFCKQGQAELAKYACILDYLMFPAIGVQLKRTQTIANGCERCDFRFG